MNTLFDHPHRMHGNSLAAYREELPNLSRRALAVLKWLKSNGRATDRQIMAGMGFGEPNSVRPRITELVKLGLLVELANTRCPVTGKTVRIVGAA